MNIKHKIIAGPDGQGYTEVWLNGMYSRIQGIYQVVQAVRMVEDSRKTHIDRDRT